MLAKSALTLEPIDEITKNATTETRLATKAYSSAVAPSSLRKSLANTANIASFPPPPVNQQPAISPNTSKMSPKFVVNCRDPASTAQACPSRIRIAQFNLCDLAPGLGVISHHPQNSRNDATRCACNSRFTVCPRSITRRSCHSDYRELEIS